MTKWQNGENEERKVQTWIDKIKYIQYDNFVLVKIDQIQLDKHKQTCWGDVFELLLPWKPLKRVAKQHNFESLMRLSHLGDLASVCQKYEKIETYAGVRPMLWIRFVHAKSTLAYVVIRRCTLSSQNVFVNAQKITTHVQRMTIRLEYAEGTLCKRWHTFV